MYWVSSPPSTGPGLARGSRRSLWRASQPTREDHESRKGQDVIVGNSYPRFSWGATSPRRLEPFARRGGFGARNDLLCVLGASCLPTPAHERAKAGPDSGPAFLLARSRSGAPRRLLWGIRGLRPWVVLVFKELAVLLVQQVAVVGGEIIDGVYAGSAGDLVGPCGA